MRDWNDDHPDRLADRLNEEAERLLAEGNVAAVVLLAYALDAAPGHRAALENLGAAATAWPEHAEPLFDRLERAAQAAETVEALRDVRWSQLGWAAAFARRDVLLGVARRSDFFPDAEREAGVGALLCELGQEEAGERRLRRVDDAPLGRYHLARLLARRGERAAAQKLVEELAVEDIPAADPSAPSVADARILGEIGLALLDLDGRLDGSPAAAVARAKAVFAAHQRSEAPWPWHLASELLVLHVRVALVEGRTEDAAWAAAWLLPPAPRDPSARLRATVGVGPLNQLRVRVGIGDRF